MSEARDKYLYDLRLGYVQDSAVKYIKELEADKAELIELLSDIAHFTKIESKKVQCYPAWWHRMEDLLKKHRAEI